MMDKPPGDETELEARTRWLAARIQESLAHVANNRASLQKIASRINVGSTILSGVITICLGLGLASSPSKLSIAAFVLSGLLTLVNGLEPFFNYRALWIDHEEAKYMFYKLRDRYNYCLAGRSELPQDLLDELMREHQRIWIR